MIAEGNRPQISSATNHPTSGSPMKTRMIVATAALGLLIGASSGCGTPAPAATSNPDRARTILRDVLESWKRGEPSNAPAKLSPPVIVADEDWLAGATLSDYHIEPNDHMIGTALRCPVSITVPNAKGKTKARTVFYLVTTEPILRVDRQD